MNKITQIMTDAVRAQVLGAEHVPIGELTDEELEALYSLSKAHDMAHLVASEMYAQGYEHASTEIMQKFQKQQLIAVYRYESIAYELEEICSTLEESKIPHIPLKGSVMRALYPEGWMRTSADIDILVKKEDTERAVDALKQALEYGRESLDTHDITLFSPSGVHLELHFDTVEEDRAVNSNAVLKRFWEHSAPKTDREYTYMTDDAMFYFYHVSHMAKHFEASGCGMRFFLDLYLLDKRTHSENERKALLTEGGLCAFAESASRLARIWFESGEYDTLSRTMEKYILEGGAYGSRQNTITLNVNKKGKSGYILSRIFPKYDSMRIIFPVLERHKYLLPVFYIVRPFKIAFSGRLKSSASELKHATSVSDGYTDSVDKMFDTFGFNYFSFKK